MKNLLKVTGILLLTVLQLFLLALAVAVTIRLTTIFLPEHTGEMFLTEIIVTLQL